MKQKNRKSETGMAKEIEHFARRHSGYLSALPGQGIMLSFSFRGSRFLRHSEYPMLPTAFATATDSQSFLEAALAHFACQTGTVHLLRDGVLRLVAHVNIPPPLLPIIDTVPIGKGIAGLAAERREPVSLCNLQTDNSGQARPAAKTTGMEGSVAVPILASSELRGVLGIAKAEAHDWSDAEKTALLEIAAALAQRL
jgi:L-methionine (R)-S-oxide reductase